MAPASVTDALQRLAALARERSWPGAEPVVVGGAVRDALLGRGAQDAVRDVDVAVPGDLQEFAAVAAARIGTRVVTIDTRFGVLRLPCADGYVDLVGMLDDDLDADLARRDFTINALAMPLAHVPPGGLTDLSRADVIDGHGGLADLDEATIRATGPRVLHEDPVRALRAVRLATQLSFEVESGTQSLMGEVVADLPLVAAERIGAELALIFADADAARGVGLMEMTGLLSFCFPELDAGRGCDQRPVHQYDVFLHQITASVVMDLLLAPAVPGDRVGGALWMGLWAGVDWSAGDPDVAIAEVRDHLTEHGMALRLATLLHDIGKPETRSEEPDGRTRFLGHSELGAEMARERLRAWRFQNAVVDRVGLLIEQHLRPGQVASPGTLPTQKALHRFHRSLGDAATDVCWLFLADSLATASVEALLPRWGAYVAHVHHIATWRPSPEAARLRRLVDGRAVMTATGLSPGPEVGRILAAIDEEVATGEITREQDALALAVRISEELEEESRG